MSDESELLQGIYAAFNRRDIETVLARMHPEVDWPNGMEGGRVYGRNGVREYWTRRSLLLAPTASPQIS
jgi:hypothetical protein